MAKKRKVIKKSIKKESYSNYLLALVAIIAIVGIVLMVNHSYSFNTKDLIGFAHDRERGSNERNDRGNTNQEIIDNNPLTDDDADEQKTSVIIPRFDEGKLRFYEKEYRDIEKTDLEPIIIDKLVKPKRNIPDYEIKPEDMDKDAAENICKYEKCDLKYNCQEYFIDEDGKCLYSEGYSEVSCKFIIPGECNKKEVIELMKEYYGDIDGWFSLGSYLWFVGCNEMGSPGYPCKKKEYEKTTWPIDCDEMPEEGKNCVMEEDCECFEYFIS
jgi:hypothetical protein